MFIADLHIHSKYSRATSRDMDVEHLSRQAQLKGISLLGTGDFTHPLWLAELREKLTPAGNGLYRHDGTLFLLSTEVNIIFIRGEKSKRIHTLIMVPDFQIAEKINRALAKFGNLEVDGRPNLSLTARKLVDVILGISADCLIIPAHVWTPWFSLFGANSGFDSIRECFEDQADQIHALETGLSSDPPMNWRLSALDGLTLVSNSDAHSPNRIGREANVFREPMDYPQLASAIRGEDREKFLFTVEFFPQEGKYHYDGHRRCGSSLSPRESMQNYDLCPICRRKVTVGVMHRVESLADRPEGTVPEGSIPCRHLVPLVEIIADALNVGPESKGVMDVYQRMVTHLGTEFDILLDLPSEELRRLAPPRVVEGILKVRKGEVEITPGYDGVYGTVKIFTGEESQAQVELF